MAGFCRNCGSPLSDGQAFCAKCGTRIGEAAPQAQPPAQAPTAAAPPAPAQYSPAAAAPAAAASSGSSFLKILLVVVLVLFFFGAAGIGALMYVGYRVRQKAREMGLNSHTFEQHKSTLGGIDGCSLLSKDDVGQAIGMPVVRAEAGTGGNVGCVYSVTGDAGELTMKHAMQLNKKQMSKSDQQTMENFGKSLGLRSGSAGGSGNTSHPGETAVFAFAVDENAAQFQMKFNKGMLKNLGPMATTDVPNLGDEAFDMAGAMLLVRKGDKLLRITYTQCPCGLDDILPLAQKLAGSL